MVTVREFAKHVNRSHVFIMQLVKKGILPRNDDGKIPLADGLAAFKAYDSAPKNKGGRPKKEEEKKTPKTKPSPAPLPKVSIEDAGKQTADAVGINAALRKADLAEKTFKAKLREHEYKEKTGEVVKKADVAEAISKAVINFQAKMRAIPPRISAVCEMRMARDIEDIMLDAIETAFSDLKKLEKQYKNE